MVGLEPIARFTHGIEAVLEKIRAGSLAVDSDIITTLLESRDHLAAMVEGDAAGSPIPGSGDLSQRLTELLRVTPPAPAPAPSRPAPEPGRPARPDTWLGDRTARAPADPARIELPSGPAQPAAPAAAPHRRDRQRRQTSPGQRHGRRRRRLREPGRSSRGHVLQSQEEGGSGGRGQAAAKASREPWTRPTHRSAGAEPSAAAEQPPTGFPVVFLPDHTVSGTGHAPPGSQPAGRAGRTARAGRVRP